MIIFAVMVKYMISIIPLTYLYNEEYISYNLHWPIVHRYMDETCNIYKWDYKDAEISFDVAGWIY
jgi:hypothetical protein